MYGFTIIIPLYNEAENLERLEKKLVEFEKIALKKTTFLFINDGSSDNSQVLIENICNRNEAFHYILLNENRGLSSAIKAGFDAVETEWLGYMDADLQTLPEDFNVLLKNTENFDMVNGIRTNRQDTFSKKMSGKIANKIRRAFTNDGMEDTGCPLKVIKTEYAKRIPLFKGLHRFLPAMVLLQNGKIFQIPVQHFPRIHGTSNFGFWNRIFGTFIDCLAFLWMKKRYIRYQIKSQA